ncbi:p21-C-terminal region-binding protein-domain-containing protein [Chiua virens]|nr:p21-C-terminal region-binding protein-domain-containing protein [Chiua virens]
MSKRKQTDEDSSDEQTPEFVDVNFDYYNVNADNDYHAINRLFMQLFGQDAERIETGPLTDLVTRVAEESGVGSTIKTEEEEDSDPYAILTVISCHDHAGLGGLIDYVLSKISAEPAFHGTLTSLLQDHPRCHVGLVLSERLINMPVQVMAPMYKMLLEEIDEDAFTHYLFLSRVYRLDPEDERESKRQRSTNVDGVYGFHPEDDEIMEGSVNLAWLFWRLMAVQYATHTVTYGLPTESVGLGRAMLVPGEKLKWVVKKISERYTV